MTSRIRVRTVRSADVALLVRHRRAMWEAMGFGTRTEHARADRVYRSWLRRRMKTRELVGWVVEERGVAVASGCVWLQEVQPRPGFDGPRHPYLLSMFTEPQHRGRGHARRIVREAIRWSRSRGYPYVSLHASRKGRGVYRVLGFKRIWEMRRKLVRTRRATTERPASRKTRRSRKRKS